MTAIISWASFIIGTVLLFIGLVCFAIEMFGVFKFKFVLNRMHVAALGDTFGIGVSLIGVIFMSGLNFTSLKLFLVVLFLWFASPVSSHLVSRLEVTTNEKIEDYCEVEK